MPLSFQQITQPAAEPVTLDQAKAHLRVSFDDEDDYITSLITAARQFIEKATNRAIFSRQMRLTLDYFPLGYTGGSISTTTADFLTWYYRGVSIRLPMPGCVSVESVSYIAADGTTKTIDSADYTVDTVSEPARITPAPGYTWPSLQNYRPGQVIVDYTAGSYGDGVEVNNCPRTITMAMLLLMGHWYEHREAVSDAKLTTVPLAVDALLAGETFDTFHF